MIFSVQKAMKILAVLSDAKSSPVSLLKISGTVNIPKPTCAHILKTLCNDGYVVRVSQTKGYTLGPATYYLTRHGRYADQLISVCRPVLSWMERNTHATVVLSVIRGSQKFIVDCFDSEQNLFSERASIRTDDIYRTATGRAILSQMDREEVRAVYEKYGNPKPGHWDGINSYEDLLEALSIIKNRKLIVTDAPDNSMHDAVGYACPIFKNGECVGAVGIARKTNCEMMKPSHEEEEYLEKILLKGAKEIQRRLDYEE